MERTRRRRQVLEAAARVFAERGYHDASVSDIIEAAGIARGTFYLYFDGKRAVFDELVDTFLVEIKSCVRRIEIGPGSAPPYDQIRANVTRIVALLRDDPDMALIVLSYAAGLDRETDAKLRDLYEGLVDMLARALETGGRLGLVRVGRPRIAARLMLGGAREMVRHLVLDAPRDEEVEDAIDEVLRVSLCGVVEGPLRALLEPVTTAPGRGPFEGGADA